MPTPTTPRRHPADLGGSKSTPAKSKPIDIGLPLGDYDTNSVRAKIRLWQQQGGGVITVNDPAAKADDEATENLPVRSKADKEPQPPKTPTRSRVENRITNNANGANGDKNGTRKRSYSTPKKRVVSDEHWRKVRNPPTTPKQTKVPTPKRITVYKINEFEKSSSSVAEKKDDARTLLTPSRLAKEGIKLHASPSTRRTAANTPARRPSKRPNVDRNQQEKHSSRRSPSSKTSASTESDKKSLASEVEGLRRATPPPKDDDDWAASEANFTELSRLRRRGYDRGNTFKKSKGIISQVLGESKKVLAPPPPPPQPISPANREAKIQAWLSSTPDPFVDNDDGDVSAVDMPAPLKTRRRSKEFSSRELSTQESFEKRRESSEISRDRSRRKKSAEYHKSQSTEETGDRSRSRSKSPQPDATSIDCAEPSSLTSVAENTPNRKSTEEKDSASPTKSLRDSRQWARQGESSDGPVLPLRVRKPFPSTGVRLSTIASEETLSSARDEHSTVDKADVPSVAGPPTEVGIENPTNAEEESKLEEEEKDQFDTDAPSAISTGLQRRLTKHSDLMSVLSNPKSSRRSVRSTRSVRSNRVRLETATLEDLMKELNADETKYMRELRTLVGGVIPVLLTCVLSRSDSAVAAGLFRPSLDPTDDINFTRPIVDMGVVLERLKNMHKRIPLEDSDALLSWALGAQRVYRDYLKAWRMGFQDVVVNLAPPEEADSANAETQSLDQGLERDENGDVINSNGEKVDVAYLLKRPLVRLKYLSKTFKGINHVAPSPKAEEVTGIYRELVELARRRSHEERARLEDESANAIDSTRARNPETLGVLTGVTIDKTRRVLARDFFNLSLHHSSGQRIDCRAELLLRDNAPGAGEGGDLLICEIDNRDRWLLFPPVEKECVSSRKGDAKGEIVVMIRGQSSDDRQWQELLCLTIEDEEIALEWVQMLGSDPIPPAISRTQSFLAKEKASRRRSIEEENGRQTTSTPKKTLRLPSPSDINVPIGEQASVISRLGKSSVTDSSAPSTIFSSADGAASASSLSAVTEYDSRVRESSPASSVDARASLPSAKELADKSTPEKTPPTLRRAKAQRIKPARKSSPSGSPKKSTMTPERQTLPASTPPSNSRTKAGSDMSTKSPSPQSSREVTPDEVPRTPRHQRVSSVPSTEMPTIKRLRPSSRSSKEATPPPFSDDEEDWPDIKTPSSSQSRSQERDSNGPPAPPPHRTPSSAQQKTVPVLTPTAMRQRRRTSSPLKHEYEPSTASETCSESETSTVRHYSMDYSSSDTSSDSSSSYTSDEDDLSDDEVPTPVATPSKRPERASPTTPPTSEHSTPSPPNSASQGPHPRVVSQPAKSTKAIASLFYWAENGQWESMCPDECTIVVSPGLIEAYEITNKHSQSDQANAGEANNCDDDNQKPKERPIIALELTPLVPIRRGTAIDISVRSPPLERSKIRKSNNILFRARSVEECEVLYGLINHARINNPTYIALQNSRDPYSGQPESLRRYNSTSSEKRTSWFGFPRRKNSYRAAKHAPSVGLASESSVGTMSTAFSALKRFGAGNRLFNIARSTITSRTGSRDGSQHDSGSIGIGGSKLASMAEAVRNSGGIGLSNAKIRLYVRESTTKWRDLGPARLTIMPATPKSSRPGTAENNNNTTDEVTAAAATAADGTNPPPPIGGSTSPRRPVLSQEKRIIIRGKTAGETLLDVCLGESSFERVARTGIAVSVWEEHEGGNIAEKGGVTGGQFRVYMIQMKSEAEAAYTFSLVGKLRY